jgi:hypothetical protein
LISQPSDIFVIFHVAINQLRMLDDVDVVTIASTCKELNKSILKGYPAASPTERVVEGGGSVRGLHRQRCKQVRGGTNRGRQVYRHANTAKRREREKSEERQKCARETWKESRRNDARRERAEPSTPAGVAHSIGICGSQSLTAHTGTSVASQGPINPQHGHSQSKGDTAKHRANDSTNLQ